MPADEMGDRRIPQPPAVAMRIVLVSALSFMAFVAMSMAGLFLYFRELVPGPLKAVERSFPEPTLQISPSGDLKRFRREQEAALSGYAWVDRSQDLLRIPIEEAMRVIAARGARAYDAPEQPEVTPSPGSRGGARP